ncbi:transferase [Streptomyces sp. NBC_00859]|uniref:transferase n=1 Tax=Streptomyces sp. NBC_00859 TaxID=2903682 RepID=UPI00386BDDCD|nr:transferase [Streptomyces sp. NBC_00859]
MTGTAEGLPAYAVDCTAGADGSIAFAVTVTGPTGLVLKRRNSGDLVRLALTEASDGAWSAVLEAGAELGEGRWDVFTEGGPAGEQRVEPGLRDLRHLIGRTPGPAATTVAARVPYRTAEGKLALRGWSRSPHAEAGDLTVRDSALTVRGQLYGAETGVDAVIEARLRGAPGQVHREPVLTGGGGAFSCTLPYGPLAGGDGDDPRFWDLWLRPAGAADSGRGVRISRILDDLAGRKSVFVYPGSPCGGADRGATATPYYTVDNDLSVRIDPGEH